MSLLENLWKMWEKIEIGNLWQQKEEELFSIRTKFSHYKVFHRKVIRSSKTTIFLNKPIYLGLSILESSKILMYEFWRDYVKTKYGEKGKLCYMDTHSFVAHVKIDDNPWADTFFWLHSRTKHNMDF